MTAVPVTNTRFVPVQIDFRDRHGVDTWHVQDVERVHGERYLGDEEGHVYVFYSLKHAQNYADLELTAQAEYEAEQERMRHVDSTVLAGDEEARVRALEAGGHNGRAHVVRLRARVHFTANGHVVTR